MYRQQPSRYPATAYAPSVVQTIDQRYSPMSATATPLPPMGMPLPGGNPNFMQQSVPVIPPPQYLAPPMAQNVSYVGSVSPVPQVAGGYGAVSYPNGGYGGAYSGGGYGGYGAASYPGDLIGSSGGAYAGGGYGGYGGQYLMPPRQNNPSVVIIDNGRRRHRSHSHGRHHHHHGHRHSRSHSHSHSLGHGHYGDMLPFEYPGQHGFLRTRSRDSL